MKNNFSEQDKEFMSLALYEAEQAFAVGDYPVGAALTVNGVLIGQARNSIFTDKQSTAHAEQKLLSLYSSRLRQLKREDSDCNICLYTTLEPCLMCLGTTLLHRITRVVVACPDPHGGAVGIDLNHVGSFYAPHFPQIEMGLMKERSADLILEFLKMGKNVSAKRMLVEFSKLKQRWGLA